MNIDPYDYDNFPATSSNVVTLRPEVTVETVKQDLLETATVLLTRLRIGVSPGVGMSIEAAAHAYALLAGTQQRG